MNGKLILKILSCVALAAFLFPFATVSCQGKAICTMSGLQLVTGTSIQGQAISPVPLAIFIFLLAIAMIVGAFSIFPWQKLSIAGASFVQVICLFILQGVMGSEAARSQMEVVMQIGFYLLLIINLFLCSYSLYLWKQDENLILEANEEIEESESSVLPPQNSPVTVNEVKEEIVIEPESEDEVIEKIEAEVVEIEILDEKQSIMDKMDECVEIIEKEETVEEEDTEDIH